MKLTPLDRQVLSAIERAPGITQGQLLRTLGDDNALYGRQRSVSRVIVKLRQRKLIEDCAERCKCCGAALTRGIKNVPLRILPQGQIVARSLLWS
jgi:hypothetical protein